MYLRVATDSHSPPLTFSQMMMNSIELHRVSIKNQWKSQHTKDFASVFTRIPNVNPYLTPGRVERGGTLGGNRCE